MYPEEEGVPGSAPSPGLPLSTRKWGIPSVLPGALMPQLADSLDAWVEGNGLLYVSAPRGYGKSTQLARWTRQRPEPVIWISASRGFCKWIDLVRALTVAIGDLRLASESVDDVHEVDSLHLLLHRVSQRVVLVIDNADLFEPAVDLELIEAEARAYPWLRVVLVASTPMASDPLRADAARVSLGREDLAWTEDHARLTLDELVATPTSPLSLAEVVRATAGQARGIVSHFHRPRGAVRPREPDELRVQWAQERLRAVSDSDAALRMLLTFSEFIAVPRESLETIGVAPNDTTLMDLIREGFIEAVPRPGMMVPGAYRVERSLRLALTKLGMGLPPLEGKGLHSTVADSFLAQGSIVFAIHHLARAGRYAEALSLVVHRIGSSSSATEIADLRDAIDSIPPRIIAADPAALAARTILARFPPVETGPGVAARDSKVLSFSRSDVALMPLATRVLVDTASLSALALRDRLDVALTLGRELNELLHTTPWVQVHDLGAGPSLFWSGLAEVELLAGNIREADDLARAAHNSATDHGNVYTRFLASAVLAATRAILGDADEVSALIREAELHYGLGGWPVSPRIWPIALARFITAVPSRDDEAIEKSTAQFRAAGRASASDWLEHAAGLGEALRLVISGQLAEAAARATPMLLLAQGYAPPLFSVIAATVNFDIQLARGRATLAAKALEGIVDLPGHPFCVASRWSILRLVQGDPLGALEASDECIAQGIHHVTRTLVPALLRRAAAQEALGMARAADETFLLALTTVPDGPRPTHFFGFEPRFIASLWDRLLHTAPDLYSRTYPAAQHWNHLVGTDSRPAVHDRLSTREIEIVRLLRRGYTNSRISQELYLSPNTVKTHLSHLYRKLGVANRREAMSAADSLGIGQA